MNKPKLDRSKVIAERLVRQYLADNGGAPCGWTMDRRERELRDRIAAALRKAKG